MQSFAVKNASHDSGAWRSESPVHPRHKSSSAQIWPGFGCTFAVISATSRKGFTIPGAAMLEPLSASKREILDAAAECFMSLGADTASIDDIAARLGSTKGRIYHHFPSKGALLAAVQLRAAGFTHNAVEPVADDSIPALECLANMCRTHVYAMLDSLAYHKVILQTYTSARPRAVSEIEKDLQAQVREGQRAYEMLFRKQIERGIAEGSIAPRNLNVAVAGLMLILNSPVFWFRPERGASQAFLDTIARDVTSMALASLRA